MTTPSPTPMSPTTTPEEVFDGVALANLKLINDLWFYVVGVASGLVCIIGVLGNVLSLLVWSSTEVRSSTCSVYFLTLAVYDLIFDFCVLANICMAEILFRAAGDGISIPYLQFFDPSSVFFAPFLSMMAFGSVYTTVALAVDRCLAVVKPLTWPQLCTFRWTIVVNSLVLVWSVLTNIPLAMEGALDWSHVPRLNKSFLVFTETQYRFSPFHTQVYLLYLFPAVSFVLPVLVIVVANVILVYKVRRRCSAMAGTFPGLECAQASRSREANRLTSQVVVISLLTLFSRCLYAIEYIWMALLGTIYIDECSVACSALSAVTLFVLAVNASVNFFCYMYFVRKFRTLLVKRLQCLACVLRSCRSRSQGSKPSALRTMSIFASSTRSQWSVCTEEHNGVQLTTVNKMPQSLTESTD